MYEARHESPIPPAHFAARVILHVVATGALFTVSLSLGMAGYSYFEHLAWRDAFLNAAMLLGGMGPVDSPHTPGGKVFAGAYALYAGLVFLVSTAIVLAPVVHRILHRFHWTNE